MARLLAPLLALLLSACAARDSWTAADGRLASDQGADAKACPSIRSAIEARAPGSLSVLSVLCRDQLVVIAGALPPDYKPAVEAVHIATTTPGVRRVETFFVPRAGQDVDDAAVAARVKRSLTADAGMDLTVVAGTVVLVGVVDDQAKADRIVASAGSVEGVKSVKSFIQLKP